MLHVISISTYEMGFMGHPLINKGLTKVEDVNTDVTVFRCV